MFKKLGLQFKISAVILVPFLVIIAISNFFNAFTIEKISRQMSMNYLRELVRAESLNMEDLIKKDYSYVNELALIIRSLYSNGVRDRNVYNGIVSNYAKNMPENIGGISCILDKNILGNDTDYAEAEQYKDIGGAYSAFYARNSSGNINRQPITTVHLSGDYWLEPKRTLKPYITSIYTDKIDGKNVEMYTWSIPIISRDGKFLGVSTVDVHTTSVSETLKNVKPYPESETFLYDHTGIVIYDSQNHDNVGKSVYDVYLNYKERQVLENIKAGKFINFTQYATALKEKGVYVIAPVDLLENINWGIEILTPEKIILKETITIRNIMIISYLILVLITVIFTPIIIRTKVVKMISILERDITKIANGDISWNVEPKFLNRHDEWGHIGQGLNKAVDNLNSIVHKVRLSADHVSVAADEVLKGNNDLSSRTETQASGIEETTASMNEMSQNIKDSIERVYQSSNMVLEAKSYIEKAGSIIGDSVHRMEAVYESSAKIMDITKLIENIAFQTNILALNASVEAARAGEQGRGFAVVASEVRNLAQTTQTSVKSITDLIENVYDKIDKATGTARESQEIFIEIQNKIDEASRIMQGISDMAVQQQSGIDQVKVAVSEMDMTTQKNAALVEEATASAELLFAQSKELMAAIHTFKLPDGTR